MLNADAIHNIACRIDSSIEYAVALKGDLVAPDIEINIDSKSSCEPSLFILSEKESPSEGIEELLNRQSEGTQDFKERQARDYAAFIEFRNNLTRAKAGIILDNLRIDEFTMIVAAEEGLAQKWFSLFIELPSSKLPAVHNLILLLAQALGENQPNKAKALLYKIKNSKPFFAHYF